MRISTYIYIGLILLAQTLFVSCNDDFLNPQPETSIGDKDVFKSYETAQAALVGVYDQLSSYAFEGLFVPIISDLTGEDVMISPENNYNWFVAPYQMNTLPNYTFSESPWWAGYKVIFDANMVIKYAQQIPNATQEQKNRIEGEAKVIRAFVMLKLAQMFAPAYAADSEAPSILLAIEPLKHDDPDIGRAPLSAVYTQMEEDLLSAINLLEYKNDILDKGFFDKRAAQATLARVYLNMQEWEKARDMAVLAHQDVKLMAIGELSNGFYYRNSETIFTVAYTADDNNVYLSIPSFYYPVYGYSSMRANNRFVEQFSNNDARNYYFVMEPQVDSERYLIVKFLHNQQVGNAERISIRASEMHLIEAECEAELGNNSAAQDALHVIRSRAIPGVQKSSAVGQALVDEILIERRKELFGEGFRWNDIKRRQSPFVRAGDHWVRFDFEAGDKDYYRMTYPIPQSEIDNNTALTNEDQNIGY
ncbi:RagB/SusD family nutrient uptake outer membrane protein [Carboxylicivirga mesophila]|uniref:RagB/SusD family nutrient uptake outer membrane protein n=1 Tax=Carboxylicivirga mesophila TaxID=1166478 RepID=A0ABS5K755_9BACT|nr:RagB/SusD family nutrient uptake outer membrane protein [Carboxylicivirga mesophila]MBS2210757.1 RagB/SusD family nutrient uptake outer membrane protein [Carboxylicivirga mesophila]